MFIELGRLVRDVEVKKVMAGNEEKSVINNCLAVSHDRDKSSFIDITAWGGTAELIGKYLKKGDEVFIESELRNNRYKKDGKELTVPYILVTKIKFTYGNKTLEDYKKPNFQKKRI